MARHRRPDRGAFRDNPVAVVDEGDKVRVRLRHADESEAEDIFDLVVGADGLRSTVRKLVLGPHEKFMHSLGTIICAY